MYYNLSVSKEEIDTYCKENNLIYFQTSAKENKNIQESMEALIAQLLPKFCKIEAPMKLEK